MISNNKIRIHWVRFICLCLFTVLSGCESIGDRQDENVLHSVGFSTHGEWKVQPLKNSSTTAMAGLAAGALLETHLRKRGIEPMGRSPNYLIEGSVERWHYIKHASAQPFVEITLSVKNPLTQAVLWSQSAMERGSRGQSLSALADDILKALVSAIPMSDTVRTPAKPQGILADTLSDEGGSVRTATNSDGLEPAMGGALPVPAPVIVESDTKLADPLVMKPMEGRSVAFYYGSHPPLDVLSQFDRLILEPDNIDSQQLQSLVARGARAYAYLSVGEVGPTRSYGRDIDEGWVLGSNPAWNSRVLDLSNAQLRGYLLKRAKQLYRDGYRGLFLDTMDSFHLIADSEHEKSQQTEGLVRLISAIATQLPSMKIITNRGFEVLERISPYVEAVAAESLYVGWDNLRQSYIEVPAEDRDWLLSTLEEIKQKYGMEVIAIDYMAPSHRSGARRVAAQIAEHGIIPWVANPELDYIGVGAMEVLPRKVLMIYDSHQAQLFDSPVHKYTAMPIEYMGYVPEYLDIASQELPPGELKGRYAGIVIWSNKRWQSPAATPWLKKQLRDAVPIALLGQLPVAIDVDIENSLGIKASVALDVDSARLSYKDDYIAPERSLSIRQSYFSAAVQNVSKSNTSHMRYSDQYGQSSDMVVTGAFGGFAFQPGLMADGMDASAYWVIDPFKFFRTALQLPNAPMPDVTTENGKRLWLAHIDGDALPSWAEMPGKRLGARVIYDEILSQYKYPHTVSVVEGEMTELSAYDDRRSDMFSVARDIFRLNHVEMASHTYSHPFSWGSLYEYAKSGQYNLNFEGYRYSADREIAGSLDFVNRELAPPGKRAKVMLWSGDALPKASDLAVLERIGIVNMNGGLTTITNNQSTHTAISPMARPVGDYLQVYAPIMNENVYTNNWLGPFDGFKRVIETFEMTEKPRRIKPIDIYYHFYSGTKIAAMRALKEVYSWSFDQEIFPLYVSDYVRKVPYFRTAGVARYLNGEWKLSGLGDVQSIRLLHNQQWPDLAHSQGLVGARQLHDGVYLHTNGAEDVLFTLSPVKSRSVHLVSSNGKVVRWASAGGRLALRFRAEVPVTVELGGSLSSGCVLMTAAGSVQGQLTAQNTLVFMFETKDTGDAALNCPA